MPDDTSVERVNLEGDHWVARVRYQHHFDDETVAEHVDVSDVAQGVEARVRDDRVEVVTVPDSPFMDESEVGSIARKAARAVETQS